MICHFCGGEHVPTVRMTQERYEENIRNAFLAGVNWSGCVDYPFAPGVMEEEAEYFVKKHMEGL